MRVALVVALLSTLVGSGVAVAADRVAPKFAPLDSIQISPKKLFDLGATDYDDDGLIDLFTTNHKFHSPLLHNDGSLTVSDRAGAAGFTQTPDYPGLELLGHPAQDQPGVYLYVTDSGQEKLPGVVHLRSTEATLGGQLRFSGAGLFVERRENARVVVDKTGDEFVVDFDVRPGARVDLRVDPIDIPFSASFDSAPPAQLPPPFPQPADVPVFVGTGAVPAASRQLFVTIRDRHGYAFADFGGTPAMDAFAVSGGLGGKIDLPGFAGRVQDELLLGSGGRFINETPSSGLIKGDCRGRGTAAADLDGNGMLDLVEGCEGKRPQVYLQKSRGNFTQTRSPEVVVHAFRTAELGGGPRAELLASVGRRGIQVLKLGRRGFQVHQTIPTNARNGQVAQFALGDVDSDGDLDVLCVSPSGNTMLRNDRGRLREVPLKRLGLPEKSVAASFVDYDNNGRVDLHLIPQGLMESTGGGRYRRTGKLNAFARANAGVTSWPDLDNDGLRDVIAAGGNSVFSDRKEVDTFVNNTDGEHWLEVDLVGAPGNVQAIGARISVGAGSGRRFQWVGQNDDSHFSQGHYRAYFGLGDRLGVSRLVVEWPDGAVSRFANVAADRLVRIAHP